MNRTRRRRVMRPGGQEIVAAMIVPQAAAGAMTMIVRSSICGVLPLVMALSAAPVAATGAIAPAHALPARAMSARVVSARAVSVRAVSVVEASARAASAPRADGLIGAIRTRGASDARGTSSETGGTAEADWTVGTGNTGNTGVEDEFFVLASVQAVPMGGGTMVVKLAASGPIAWQRLPDGEAPGGVAVAGRIRVRLFGVNRSEPGALIVTEAGSVAAAPDGHGNLDVTLAATGPLATQPLRVRQGRTANEIELLAAPAGGAGMP